MRPSPSAGYTLVELLTVLVLAALLAGLAYPRLDGFLSRTRTDAALSQLSGDLHYTRMLAIRSGRTAVLRAIPGPRCETGTGRYGVAEYRIVLRDDAGRVAKRVRVGDGVPGLCLEMNGADSIAFSSRGLLHGFMNRTVWVRHGPARDSLAISTAGRILRRF
jgi:prepilin-type N-terminal cleavage/methylation domain-containing protein